MMFYLDLTPFRLAGKKRDEEARKLFQQEVDHIILRLICVRGVAPTLVDSPEWKELMAKLNPRYHPSSSTTFVNNYIPKEAVAVRQSQLAELKKHNNLTLTFDGMSTREPQSLYTVHATTPSRETYFLDGYEDSTSRHTINWVKEKLFKTINEIGAEKWAAVCSDSTAVTKNSRKEIVMCIPTMLDFNNVCHHLHNTIKNITTLECFRWMISLLKAIVKHFSKSTISVAHLRKERRVEGDDHTVNGLQKIGKTRFGTHWSAAVSLQQCLANIKTLVENKIVKFKNKKAHDVFMDWSLFGRLGHDLETYITIVGPFIRSLWSLEASHANASDVFLFWLAIGASLKDLVQKDDRTRPGNIPVSLMHDVIAIYNRRWKEFFRNDVYFTAFALDPRYPTSDFVIKPVVAAPAIVIPPQNPTKILACARRPLPHPRAYNRVKESLKPMLRAMLDRCKMNPHATDAFSQTVREYGPTGTVDELRLQIDAFWRQEHPFNRPMKDGNTLAWWQAFEHHPGAQVLAALAVKIFSALVNSMPDEQTGSTFTWLNSPTRGNQNAQTLIDMVRIGQWYKDHARAHTAEKIPFRPTVKFRDIDKDLLATITSAGTRPLSSGDPAPNALIYDSDEGNDSDDVSESGDEPGKFRSVFAGTTVEVDDDIDLNNPFFLDLISPVPIVQPTSTIHTPRACVQPAARGGDPDWDW